MYKRYEGNTGRMRQVGEGPAPFPPPRPAPPPPSPPRTPPLLSGLKAQLARLLPGERGPWETEDLILLLILYLLYRETGDRELLYTLGAMFLL